MKRLTQKLPDGTYTFKEGTDPALAAAVLAGYENLVEALDAEFIDAGTKMEELRRKNKTKSATYLQLFANRLTLSSLISRLKLIQSGNSRSTEA